MSSLLDHPLEILRLIVSLTPFPDALNIPLVCKKLRDACDGDPMFIDKRKIVIENGKNWENFSVVYGAKGVTEWDVGMTHAARGGHRDLVDLFIERGARWWDWGMAHAARGGHRDLVVFFISKGATRWDWGMVHASKGGHRDLVNFFHRQGGQ